MAKHHKPIKILLVDYDDTIVDNYGDFMPGAIDTLRDLLADGWQLILWTCREGEWLDEAVRKCNAFGITFAAINEGFVEINGVMSRKPLACWHIDDRNIGGFIGWDKVRELLL